MKASLIGRVWVVRFSARRLCVPNPSTEPVAPSYSQLRQDQDTGLRHTCSIWLGLEASRSCWKCNAAAAYVLESCSSRSGRLARQEHADLN